MKRISSILSIGIIIGFIIGFLTATNKILLNRYIGYRLYRLVCYSYQEALNRWIMTAFLFSVAALIVSILTIYCIKKIIGVETELLTNKYIKFFNNLIYSRYIKLTALCLLLSTFLFNIFAEFFIYKTDERPNIIFISIDDLRADHLGCYGYFRDTSPNIDLFAKNNILFENCYIPEPWTLTCHLSMLTSLYPITHGVDMINFPLHPAITTLAEVLKNEGYYTMGFANSLFMRPEFGFKQGFDYYVVKKKYNPEKPCRNAQYHNMFIKKKLLDHKGDKLFLFIHYYDVHSDFKNLPYEAPPPYDKLFSANYDGKFAEDKFGSLYLSYINKKKITLNEKNLEYLISLYDNGIAYMDKCIGDFFKILKEMNLYDNSLIIITADHGEEFQEHGYMLHENPYYFEEQVHVPLILKMPKKRSALKTFNRRIKGLVEVIDIMPSILDYLNIPYIKLQGKSFQNLLNSDANGKDYVFGFGDKQLSTRPEKIATTKQKKWLMVRSKRWKLISDDGLKEERFKLFDLENDPEERENLAIKRPDIKNRLLKKIKEKIEESKKLRTELLGSAFALFSKDQKDTARKELFTEEEKEQLKALGYME